jgi:4-hydroxyproline epimerase
MKTNLDLPRSIEVIDSHTAGEPTRCVISGGPDLGLGSVAERLERMRTEHDVYRRAILLEPRGSDVLVFNNAGYLGMCGHGTIGVAATLAHLGRIGVGQHRFETPVGDVQVSLAAGGEVTIANVEAHRYRAHVALEVPGHGVIHGDVAWGGNWFFLVEEPNHALMLEHVDALTDFTWRVRQALSASGVTGADGAEIDHIELCGPPRDPINHGRNFVLCPGKAYDRSPCGTGTSAKMACLAAAGKLEPGQPWRQEGILGTVFTGRIRRSGDRITPLITGSAYVTAESTLIFDPGDPFRGGITAAGEP